MLIELTVRNFAVIEETRLTLGRGLNVVTGETGAGKSLLVDALEFVLGGVVDRGLIRAGANKASVEAVFQVPDPTPSLIEALAASGVELDDEGTLVLARETHREGRTVSRLNGRAIPVSSIQEVGARLVDIHGQGSHLSLLDTDHQLAMLDAFARLDEERQFMAALVLEVRELEATAATLTASARESEQRRDLLRFQVEEIGAAGLAPGEEASLIRERDTLANARAIHDACASAYDTLYSDETNAGDLIALAVVALRAAPDPTGALAPQIEALEASAAQVEESARDLRAYADTVEAGPSRLAEVEERIEAVRRLKRKYGDTEEAVLAFALEARRDLDAAEHSDERREELAAALIDARERAASTAWSLSLGRGRAAAALGEAAAQHLKDLGMGQVRLELSLSRAQADAGLACPDGVSYAFDASGIDRVEYLVETNRGEGLKQLAKAASGGETSRLMLALTSALRSSTAVPTLVFDEIDSGIGARASEVVGRKLWSLGGTSQVLCVTHLPQIAAYADRHFRVEKSVEGDRTFAGAHALGEEDRLGELAEMLGGSRSEELDGAARQMLAAARASKGR
jgi:DNA repair protein RecN (Recombination protein N)